MRIPDAPQGSYRCAGCGSGYPGKAALMAHLDRGHLTFTIDELNQLLEALAYQPPAEYGALEEKIAGWRP